MKKTNPTRAAPPKGSSLSAPIALPDPNYDFQSVADILATIALRCITKSEPAKTARDRQDRVGDSNAE